MELAESTEPRLIGWDELEKTKFYPLLIGNIFVIRSLNYPLTNVRTRLLIQKGKEVYKGTYDAFKKIVRAEGIRGLYSGFFVNSLQAVNSLVYITTLESVKQYVKTHFSLAEKYPFIAASCGGFCATLTGQTLSVPFDVVSQHLMIKGQKKLEHIKISEEARKQKFGSEVFLVKEIYRRHGLLGFFKGYPISVAVFGLNSAIWWPFYEFYVELLDPVMSGKIPGFLLHGVAASCGGVSTAALTNVPELFRVSMQVGGTSFYNTCVVLWKRERMRIFWKGLTARMLNSVVFSFTIMVSYTIVKKWSLKDEYKDGNFL